MALKIPKAETSQRPQKIPRMETQKVCEIIDLDDDVVTFSSKTTRRSRRGTTRVNAISVEEYCEEAKLRRAIMASSEVIDLVDDSDVETLWFKTPEKKPLFSGPSVTEVGESSSSKPSSALNPGPTFVCEICADEKPSRELFAIGGCDHAYCTACTAAYVASKLQDNVTAITFPAPGCAAGTLEPEHCRAILPAKVFDRWGAALCEAAILASEKVFYCPFKDCSAMLIDDAGEAAAARESSCPNCHRMFCAQCRVTWHAGISCEEFQKLGKEEREREDLMLMALAKNKKWKRCPKCMIYVERIDGCLFMKCRCGVAFCYNCGNIFENTNTHYCYHCKH